MLVEACRLAQKEKVFRMALGSLRNLLGFEDLALAGDMVEAGLMKIVITRQLQVGTPGYFRKVKIILSACVILRGAMNAHLTAPLAPTCARLRSG